MVKVCPLHGFLDMPLPTPAEGQNPKCPCGREIEVFPDQVAAALWLGTLEPEAPSTDPPPVSSSDPQLRLFTDEDLPPSWRA